MRTGHATNFLLSSLFLTFGLKAISADSEEENDLVVPFQLTEDEVHLLQENRGQRSLGLTKSHRFTEDGNDLFIILPAFGKELYLQLKRDSGFLSEDFVIEEKEYTGTKRLTQTPNARLCFYSGYVVNQTNSYASLSTCGGLTGVVQTGNEHLFVEPVTIARETFSGVEHKVVRRRRSLGALHRSAETHPGPCATVKGEQRRVAGLLNISEQETRPQFSDVLSV